jgi:hypothetical protein
MTTDRSVREDLSLESLVAQAADEFLERRKRGEQPDVEEYAARHPRAAGVLRKVLASLQLLGLSPPAGAAESGAASGTPGVRHITPDGQDLLPPVNLATQEVAVIVALTAGADGNAYALTTDSDEGTENPRLWQITPDGQAIPFQVPELSAGPAAGPDGNIWYATPTPTQLTRFTPDGSTTSFPLPISTISGITTGPDGNLWLIGGFSREIDQFIPDDGGGDGGRTAPGTHGPGGNHAAADVVLAIAGTESLRWEVAGQQPVAGVVAGFSHRESEAAILARGSQVPADGSALATHPHHVRAGATDDAGLTDALAETL